MASWPYNTRRWQRLRKVKLSTDPLCEDCAAVGRVVAARQVDHVNSINDGGDPWDMQNLSSKCSSCHSRKTSHVEVHRHGRVPVRGCDLNGRPIDRGHSWNEEISES